MHPINMQQLIVGRLAEFAEARSRNAKLHLSSELMPECLLYIKG